MFYVGTYEKNGAEIIFIQKLLVHVTKKQQETLN